MSYIGFLPTLVRLFKIGDLYARAFLRNGEPHPVEPVIDSSRLNTLFDKQIWLFLGMNINGLLQDMLQNG